MQSRYDNEEKEVCQGGLPKKIFPKRITSAEEVSLNDRNIGSGWFVIRTIVTIVLITNHPLPTLFLHYSEWRVPNAWLLKAQGRLD